MMEKIVVYFNRFFGQLKIYGKAPEMLALAAILASMGIAFLASFFYVPAFLQIIIIIVFASAVFVITNNQLKLIYWKREARAKNNQLASIIDYLQDGVIVYDTNLKALTFNNAAQRIFGVAAEEVVGKYLEPGMVKNKRLSVLAQVMFPSLAAQAKQISETAWPQIIDFSFENPPLYLRTVLHQIIDEGKTIGFLKLLEDKTRERLLLKSKDEFITVAAHQLRTPLTALGWGLETVAQNAAKNPEIENITQEMRGLIVRSLKIINDLLDAAKIEEGQFGYSFQEINCNEFLADLVAQAIPIAKNYKVTVTYLRPPETYRVYGDTKKLAAAFINILDNAIKYNTAGGTVSVSMEKLANKDFVKIIVEDTGIGIVPEDAQKLFTKLYRGANAIAREPNGSGLGLYIAKNIIKRHGGEIGFESIIHRGSAFWFTLPTNQNLIPPQEMV